jgi:hypothetical protein
MSFLCFFVAKIRLTKYPTQGANVFLCAFTLCGLI